MHNHPGKTFSRARVHYTVSQLIQVIDVKVLALLSPSSGSYDLAREYLRSYRPLAGGYRITGRLAQRSFTDDSPAKAWG